jgi:membrane associated rhomboid family serine protease
VKDSVGIMRILETIRRPFRFTFFNASFILIGINVGVYLLTSLLPQLQFYLSMNPAYVIQGKMYWQFFTYMFVHSGLTHLIFNMLGLFFFGHSVERSLGSREFLLLYLLSGTVCGFISFLIYLAGGAYTVFLLGASGAIYAILLAYAVLFPRSQIFIWGVLPIPAPLLIAIYAGIEIANQLLNIRSGVAHMTHLTGFVFAWMYFIIRLKINPWKEWKNAYR